MYTYNIIICYIINAIYTTDDLLYDKQAIKIIININHT